MKVEMKESLGEKHLWALFGGDNSLDQAQVIVDLEHRDVRIVSAPRQKGATYTASVVKVMLSKDMQVQRILRDDIFQHDITANPTLVKRSLQLKIEAELDQAFEEKMLDGTREMLKRHVKAAIDEVIGSANQRELTGAEQADTQRQVEAYLKHYGLETVGHYSTLRHDLISMVNVAKGGYP
jgi:hypothetical protein